MAHLRTYKIFPDDWDKNWSTRELNNARLILKSYVTNKETELGIREVSTFFTIRVVSFVLANQDGWCHGPMPKKFFGSRGAGAGSAGKVEHVGTHVRTRS